MFQKSLRLILIIVMLGALLLSGCKAKEGNEFGQSFNTIVDRSGNSFLFDGGYSSIVAGKSGVFSPGSVLIVGIPEGVELMDQTFEYGSIILVEGTPESPTFRLAQSNDNIQLIQSVTVFGKNYSEGKFKVPADGILATPK